MKALLPLTFTLATLSGGLLFHIKHEVLNLENTLKDLTHKVVEVKENLTTLKTEWSYLTQPQRIHNLALKYLPKFQSLQKKQLVAAPVLARPGSLLSHNP